jgi:hypothetical protein
MMAPMKHAGAGSLEVLSDLLQSLRTRTALVERRPGIFYLGGKAFLHFHEDPAGLFADLRLGREWHRFPVNERDQRAVLLATIDRPASPRRCLPTSAMRESEGAMPSAFKGDGAMDKRG